LYDHACPIYIYITSLLLEMIDGLFVACISVCSPFPLSLCMKTPFREDGSVEMVGLIINLRLLGNNDNRQMLFGLLFGSPSYWELFSFSQAFFSILSICCYLSLTFRLKNLGKNPSVVPKV